jgi:ubiquinone biosynthesis protein COQ9
MQRENSMEAAKAAVLRAAEMHVPFDGWSEAALKAAVADSGTSAGLAAALFPRGAVDLALAYHQAGDAAMVERLAVTDMTGLRYRDKIAAGVRFRLEACTDKELVRRGTTLFALPQHAAEGARAIWGTSDAIWKALGDTSTDASWYSKRSSLSAVYAATVLYWLGDDSPDHVNTWDFLNRRIDQLVALIKFNAKLADSRISKALLAGPLKFLTAIKAPVTPDDLPGSLKP